MNKSYLPLLLIIVWYPMSIEAVGDIFTVNIPGTAEEEVDICCWLNLGGVRLCLAGKVFLLKKMGLDLRPRGKFTLRAI